MECVDLSIVEIAIFLLGYITLGLGIGMAFIVAVKSAAGLFRFITSRI